MVNIRPGVMFLPLFHKYQSLGPFCFLFISMIHLQCNPELFADDTSLFATVHNIKKAKNDLNNDLTKITKWAFQWKMTFNPDISKQAHEVIFFRKRSVSSHPPLITYQLLKRIPKNIWECSLIRN